MTTRFFNTAGPCNPNDHYMLPAAQRLPQVYRLVDRKGYFVIHAPRQTGKTTTILGLAEELNRSGRYIAIVLSVEVGAAFNDDPGRAEQAILEEWQSLATFYLPPPDPPPAWPESAPGRQLGAALQSWAEKSPLPLVLFLDEIDALQNQTLISVLRQLRSGYSRRPGAFPWSVALIGLRDVRDYKVASGGSDHLHTASPFNIKLDTLTLQNFTPPEVATLYQQHTGATGQPFTPAALQLAFDLTQGQPWLVNALAALVTDTIVPDTKQPITEQHILTAKEKLIARQDTHLDSLAERLREPRVRQIIEPLLGGYELQDMPADDIRFVLDLGLCRRSPAGNIIIANPIYREVLPAVLTNTAISSMPHISPTWLTQNNRLDKEQLLLAFLKFWRQHGQPLLSSAPYHEVAPHLVLMAFLHRVVNGGGYLEREYAIGSRRMDICLRYGPDTLAIELKVWRKGEKDPLSEGLEQLDSYLSGLGLDSGWLVIFDRRPGLPPISERTTTESHRSPSGRSVTLIRG